MTELTASNVLFYSDADEKMFFAFLQDNAAVRSVQGNGSDIRINVQDAEMTYECFMSLYAVLKRYGVDVKQLSDIKLSQHHGLSRAIRDEKMVWHQDIFGA